MSETASREHHEIEQKLQDLMVEDRKERNQFDRLMGEVAGCRERLRQIAERKAELNTQLTGLYKKQAGRKGKR